MFPVRSTPYRSILGDSLIAVDYFPATTTTSAVTITALAPYVRPWMKPPNARMCIFILCSGGGGGGSGYAGAQGSSGSGGAGGGNGVLGCLWVPAIFLPDYLLVSVGRGGAGASGVVSGNGTTGTAGYPTYILSKSRDGTGSYKILAGGSGGGGGAGGLVGAAAGGASQTTIGAGTFPLVSVLPNNVPTNNVNGASSVNGGAGAAPTSTTILRTPGSSGGGVNASNTAFAGGASGRPLNSFPVMKQGNVAGVADALAGSMSLNVLLQMYGIGVGYGGAGGSGMTSATSVQPGARGGDGDHCGCGGGGGGATTSPSNTSGRGGNGGDGFCYIISI